MRKRYLIDAIEIGQIVATDNVKGFEGYKFGVYLGRHDEPRLCWINWLFGSMGLTSVYIPTFNRQFYPIKFKTISDNDHKVQYKKRRIRYEVPKR